MRGRLLAWVAFVAVISGIAYASRLTAGSPGRNALYEWSTAVAELIVFAVILAITLAIAGPHRELLALRRPRSWGSALALCSVLLVAAYAAIASIDAVLHGSREQGLTPTGWQPQHAGAYAANFVVIAMVAPFVEELLFRGLGYSLLEPFGRTPAILSIGVAFGLYHGLVEALPELVLFGCFLAFIRSRTDSVYPGMLVHATFNSISLIAAVVT